MPHDLDAFALPRRPCDRARTEGPGADRHRWRGRRFPEPPWRAGAGTAEAGRTPGGCDRPLRCSDGAQSDGTISPAVWVRARVKRSPASAQFTMFHHALT